MVLSVSSSVSNIVDNSDNYIIQSEEIEDVYFLGDYISKDVVYEDELTFSNKYTGVITMPIETIELSLSGYISGDILEKGKVINDYVIPYDLRIREIGDGYIVVDNLEETKIYMHFLPSFKIENINNLSINAKYYSAYLDIVDINFYFDTSLGEYAVELKVNNEGDILNFAKVSVYVDYIKYIDGLFVNSSYLYNDQLGDYVYKVINIKGIEFYKRIDVTILDIESGFSKIEGDLNDGNVIIQI